MELTIKQRKWMRLYVKLGNATEAAMQSYDCKDRESAAQIGYENLRKLDYRNLLEEAGLTDELLLRKTAEGLHANKFFNTRTSATGYIEVPDHAVRLRYVEIAYKLKHRLTERKDITTDNQPLPTPIMGGLSVKSIQNS